MGNSNPMEVHRTLKRLASLPFSTGASASLSGLCLKITFLSLVVKKKQCRQEKYYLLKATFRRNDLTNISNSHVWSDVNPRTIVESRHQFTFKSKCLSKNCDNFLLDPVFLPTNLESTTFLNFL